ncbi:copper chaperone PCu(A)C [Pikeienuella piscinae]|uniref:Copper chaperone PCu(A)C n=1 Tax=Pikeienuella piscinae TaxID=2748098 RepID=A0A7M3T6I9_9RHOB|nr:copper chaperone PCu(A)C [Pikeienuella piscinae]QIE57620.1 copper chaperone PCu(A)C [Pikeienuella piscinae]
MKLKLLAAAFAALLPMSAAADHSGHAAGDGAIMAVHPYAFATAATAKTGGAYVSLENHGPADRLVGVKSDVAAKVELHESLQEDGVMKMRAVEGLPLPEDGAIEMAPGGYHIMLMGLHRPLVEGESVPITLVFESGAELEVETPVKARGEMGGHADHSGHSGHSGMKKSD